MDKVQNVTTNTKEQGKKYNNRNTKEQQKQQKIVSITIKTQHFQYNTNSKNISTIGHILK